MHIIVIILPQSNQLVDTRGFHNLSCKLETKSNSWVPPKRIKVAVIRYVIDDLRVIFKVFVF